MAAVTLGKPYEAKMFCAQRNPDIVCLSNPDQTAYQAYRIDRLNLLDLASPGMALAGMRATAAGYKLSVTDQDMLQKSATFIVDMRGQIQYAYYNRNAHDHPDIGKLKAVVERMLKPAALV